VSVLTVQRINANCIQDICTVNRNQGRIGGQLFLLVYLLALLCSIENAEG